MPILNWMTKNPLRQKIAAQEVAYGLWVTLESATISEVAAELELDWVCIDLEHGSLSFRDIVNHARAIKGSQTAIIVRVPAINSDYIKRSLDLGANGVLLPLVRSNEDLREGFSYARYPPTGVRAIGSERAIRWGLRKDSYLNSANEETMVIPLIETAEAALDIENILDVSGLEAVFFGPTDLSASQGHFNEWEGPGVAEDILRMTKLSISKGVATGVVATSIEDAQKRKQQGFQMIGLGTDIDMMIRKTSSLLRVLKE